MDYGDFISLRLPQVNHFCYCFQGGLKFADREYFRISGKPCDRLCSVTWRLFFKICDMVLPFGAGCPTSIALGNCKMMFASGPFDWIRVPNVCTVAELLAQRMEGSIDYSDLEKMDENASYLIVRNYR